MSLTSVFPRNFAEISDVAVMAVGTVQVAAKLALEDDVKSARDKLLTTKKMLARAAAKSNDSNKSEGPI